MQRYTKPRVPYSEQSPLIHCSILIYIVRLLRPPSYLHLLQRHLYKPYSKTPRLPHPTKPTLNPARIFSSQLPPGSDQSPFPYQDVRDPCSQPSLQLLRYVPH